MTYMPGDASHSDFSSKASMIEITCLASSTGPLTKRISLSELGGIISDGSACLMTSGTATRLPFNSLHEFAVKLSSLSPNEAIALGALRPGLDDTVKVITQRRLTSLNGSASPDQISRTASFIGYEPGRSALALIDIDTKGMPESMAAEIKGLGGYWKALLTVIPELADVSRAIRTSTSSGIRRTDTGAPIKGSDGVHIFLQVEDGADIERFLRTLHDRCWLAGYGWMTVGAGGQLLERSLIDRTVFAAERLVFEAPPLLAQTLAQDAVLRTPRVTHGQAAATRTLCRDLTGAEQAKLRQMKGTHKAQLKGASDMVRAKFVEDHAAIVAKRTGCSPVEARLAVERQCGGVLRPLVVLPFDAEEWEGMTAGDVLADPDKFLGATLADPLEGIEYGRGKAKIMRRPDGTLWINSFAHGRTTYELQHDRRTIEALIAKEPSDQVVDCFVRALLTADVAPDEEQALRDMVKRTAGVTARSLDARIKGARQEQKDGRAQAEAERRIAARTDTRLQVPAPHPDDERLPVMRTLDDVLTDIPEPIPPMRDLDGQPLEVRVRPPMLLHELTSSGSNQAEMPQGYLPPPALPLLTRHDRFSLAHEIERHIEYFVETKRGQRSVALPGAFVDHFMAYRDSRLPRVGAIVTAPLVMPNGELLAPNGLDRERRLVFSIEPALMAMMPKPADCTPEKGAAALDYLATKWLCDVATDFAGKCVLISLALTILERTLLPERPAFFITAGKRGGGKTTAIMMLILAVTGKKASAAAWSPNDEERRKAILAYLQEGLPAMVWDNIPLGTAISCPTLEKVLTAESYSDRVLGQTTTKTVPSFTVMAFTGNNIGPKGDMASRSLRTSLNVDRVDPENRPFTHSDPVAWTLQNRGTILRALYTILLANQQLQPGKQAVLKTRFKSWWRLVGSAIENAAAELVKVQEREFSGDRYAEPIDFNKLFAAVEGEDEEGATLSEVLELLDRVFPGGKPFKSNDLVKLIHDPMQGEEDVAATLKDTMDAGKRGGVPSTKSVGRALTNWAGAPVAVGDETMMLERRGASDQAKQKHALSYRIRRL